MGIIFLNGCTSAGKSRIALALQELLPEPYLLTGIDDAFAMLPQRMHNHADGFFFDRNADGLIHLNFGTYGRATLKAHQAAAAATAGSGVNLILDEVVLSRDLMEGWRLALRDLKVFWVGILCDLAELERREIARGDRIPGQARGQFDIVHQHMQYDLEIDSTSRTPIDCARQIVEALRSH